ncbi:MAG: hypothetical protein RIR26_2651 [Pseudomonadota bacterium]|jgi:hypothetical protein
MGEVLSFKKSGTASQSKKTTSKKGKVPAPKKQARKTPQTKRKTAQKKETMSSESIKLWWISQEFDVLIRKAVLDKHIPVEELAAVMAHRLGSLLMVSERTPELTLFCMKVISKITNQPKPGSNAS